MLVGGEPELLTFFSSTSDDDYSHFHPPLHLLESPIREELKKMNRDLTFLVDFSDSGSQDPKKKRKLTIKYYPVSDPVDTRDDGGDDSSRGSGRSDRYARKEPVLWRTFEGKDDYALRSTAASAWREGPRGSEKAPKDKVT
ncbi:hypothetical protein A7U60_g4562 [Sanghuangporus baumii]|uniref:Uncharacterized protein n=1 Tax=Sanghuangporus baumii TaxID=108892 RepID=A0A9Q5HYH6_SANBA|nr:hypothetical protein A7U60_g4562 [Sanghuangporus baumii]